MFTKIKEWIIGKVIMKKVLGKFVKHAAGALVGLLSSPAVAPWLEQLGVSVDESQLTAGLMVILTGLFGAIFNYVEHRFIKK
jgi:hypothetical protein